MLENNIIMLIRTHVESYITLYRWFVYIGSARLTESIKMEGR